ncbi:MAG: N-acetylmuramoyl-L-alanine amidase [Candidatus Velthaea sp.]
MNRSRARVFSFAAAAALLFGAFAPSPVRAQSAAAPNFWFAGTKLVFDHAVPLGDDVAVSIRDGGLQRFLSRVGATLSYSPQQRYVVVTAADRRVITFVVADATYSVAGVGAKAPFAPFLDGNDVEIPLLALARALYVEPVVSGGETVLEPQLGALDVHPDGKRTIVTLRGATALKYAKVSETPERVQVTFTGVGSTLAQARRIGGGIDEVDVLTGGVPRNPYATVTIEAPRGSQHLIAASSSPYEFTVVFGPPGVALDLRGASPPAVAATAPPVAYAPPAPAPAVTAPPAPSTAPPSATAPQTGPATVTNLALEPVEGGLTVRLTLNGTATYDWHRLNDNRWYVDLHQTILSGAGRDERPGVAAVESVRIRQIGTADAPSVRVAFTLRGDRRIEIAPGENQLTIAVGTAPEKNLAHTGNGEIGGAGVAQSVEQSPAGPPVAPIGPAPEGTPWKFAPNAPGSRLIVIDPGHGGADMGTAHNGLVEKILTFDIALRLRALLIRQGWTVRLTRDRDVDPISPDTLAAFQNDGKPNASDRAYLQTRCDVANSANARMFISIHVNYAPSTAVNGTTIYYSKPQDVALAQSLERSLIPAIGTKDDGVVHNDFYVTKHTTMPAVLIETAFISNPADAARLADPNFLQSVAGGIAAGVKSYAGALPALSSRADR